MADGFKACSVEGCNGNARTQNGGVRGLCRAHYLRFWRSPAFERQLSEYGSPLDFIINVALQHKTDECLIWPFARGGNGYAYASLDGKVGTVHRYVCRKVNGEPPTPKHDAAHSCGKGHEACISPVHLSWKTRKENCADMMRHGTHYRQKLRAIKNG